MAVKQLSLQGFLGSGGQARVYRGSCEGKEMAFKCLLKPLSDTAEASLLLRLYDARIIKVQGVSLDPLLPGIMLEHAAGSTLRLIVDVMAGGFWRPSLSATAYLAHEINGILRHLHRSGVIHNDVSPANILVIPDGSLKLCDFGNATLAGAQSVSRPPFGKRPYMALELLYGGRPSFSSDRFALAAVLFEFLTGQYFRPAEAWASFTLLASLKDTLPVFYNWILRALAPLQTLRPPYGSFPAFSQTMLLKGKDEFRQWVKLAPVEMKSAGELKDRVIDFMTL